MPTVPACGSTGCWHGAAPPRNDGVTRRCSCSSGAPGPGTSPTLIGFSSQPAKPGRDEPVAASLERQRAQRDDRDRCRPHLVSRASARASVPSMSGSRRSIRITSGRCSPASAIPSAPFAAWSVRKPGRAQHVPGELEVLLVVIDDQDERAPRLGRPAGIRAGDGDGIAVSSTRADPARARRGSLPRP